MDQRDRLLLQKQVGQSAIRRHSNGLLISAIVAVFFAGLTLGAFLFAPKPEPTRTAMNEATSTMSFFLNGAPPVRRQ
jgi:NhaP-type Na+/H+ or K+/H+ antiporter